MGKAAQLELYILGGLAILLDGEPVKGLASRKADALLVYLAVTGKPHTREHLATLLWDDRPLDRSLANLSVVLNSLKKQLEPFLLINRKTIALNPIHSVHLDLQAFNALVEAWETRDATDHEERKSALDKLDQVLSEYKGDFLRGFHLREARGFDEWVAVQRERALQVVQANLRLVAQAYLRQGDLSAAIRPIKQALDIDPLQEELQRVLIKNLALLDRHSEALAQYQVCAAVLRDELDIEPSQPTRQLYDRILARRERAIDNLPAQGTQIIGREIEVGEIYQKLTDPEIRLLTLVGAGGIGKTRLAIEAARRLRAVFLEGVWMIDLAPLDDPGLIARAIGRVLAMPDKLAGAGDLDPREAMIARLLDFLATKEICLIMDNCEHLLDASAQLVARLLRHCPELKILVTTRERFDLPEEQIFSVRPLEIPQQMPHASVSTEDLRNNDSIRLFVARARAVREPFVLNNENATTLVRICRALDGMPLAIEIAASRLRSTSLIQMAENLEESIEHLGREHAGSLPRHQTLDAAIDWSYRLLSEEEQRLFLLTTLFRGGFDVPALSYIAGRSWTDRSGIATSLAQLVEKSLVTLRDADPAARRYFLLEPVRQFGLKRMREDSSYERARADHASYYLELGERLGPKLHGRKRKANISLLELEADNLRVALSRLLESENSEACLRFAQALWEGYWLNQGYFSEGQDWIERILAVCDESMGSPYGVALLASGAFAWTLGDLDKAMDQFTLAQECGESLKDKHLIQWTLYWQAFVYSDRSNFSAAEACLTQGHALALEVGAARGAAWHVYCRAHIARVRGMNQEAKNLFSKALETLTEEDIFGAGWCYIYLGHLAIEDGEFKLAREYLREGKQIYEDLENSRGLGGAERGLGLVELEEGHTKNAEAYLRRSRRLFEQLGWVKMESSSMIYLGFIAIINGRTEEASDLLLESLGYQVREGDWHSIAHVLFALGLLAIHQGELQSGNELFAAAEVLGRNLKVTFPHHLNAAVDQAREGMEAQAFNSANNARSAENLVNLILAEPRGWLGALVNPVR